MARMPMQRIGAAAHACGAPMIEALPAAARSPARSSAMRCCSMRSGAKTA
jgi:hypothetical protein